MEDNKAAEDHITAALKQSPRNLPAAMAKARLMRRTKRTGIEEYLNEVLKWPNAVVEVNLELGRYYRGIDKLDQAKVALEKAIESMGSHPPGAQSEILLSYARVMEDRGDDEVALNTYKTAGQKGNLEAWYRAAQMLAKGDKDQKKAAIEALDRYLAAGESLRYTDAARQLKASIK